MHFQGELLCILCAFSIKLVPRHRAIDNLRNRGNPMIRFIHTADLQLGMPFNWAEGDAGARLRQLRLDAIDHLATVTAEHEAAFVLVAGDLFDANTVDDRTVVQACEKFRQFDVPVLVIPGNHDHCAGPDCVFRRSVFTHSQPENLIVLDRPEPWAFDDGHAVILPAPLRQRRAAGDTTRHITADFGRELAPNAHRIGLAHGGMPWFGENADGEATNAIPQNRASDGQLDYLALGDWHSTKEIGERTWYSGSPEPTTFRQPDAGNLLLVEIESPGDRPRVEKIEVGQTQWIQHQETLSTEQDVGALSEWFSAIERPLDTLVRLELTGTLSFEAMEALESLLGQWSSKLLHLRRRGDGVVAQPTEEEIEAIATDGYVRMAIERLQKEASAGQGDAAREADDALHLLHRLHVQQEGE